MKIRPDFFFRPYFHYCLRSVHNYKDRFHIHFCFYVHIYDFHISTVNVPQIGELIYSIFMCIYVFQSSSLGNVKRVQLSTATVLNWHQLNLVHIQKGRFLAQFGSMVHIQEHCRNKRSFVHHGHTDMIWMFAL